MSSNLGKSNYYFFIALRFELTHSFPMLILGPFSSGWLLEIRIVY